MRISPSLMQQRLLRDNGRKGKKVMNLLVKMLLSNLSQAKMTSKNDKKDKEYSSNCPKALY